MSWEITGFIKKSTAAFSSKFGCGCLISLVYCWKNVISSPLKSIQKTSSKILLELNLSKNNLTSFPDKILVESPQLKFLNLEENEINFIPELTSSKNIYSLNLNKNKIKKIENIKTLKNLERLSLNNNQIEKIENLEKNINLRFLFLGKNRIKTLENIEKNILFIEELILCENNIENLPEKFSLPYIKFLDLNENKIKNLNSIFFCPSLENLLLKDNNITEENFNST